jgi:hypothetical protein
MNLMLAFYYLFIDSTTVTAMDKESPPASFQVIVYIKENVFMNLTFP